MRKDHEQDEELFFPKKGVDISKPLGEQPPGTTPIGNNVRWCEAAGKRLRGGSRSGLTKLVSGQVNGSNVIQDLDTVIYMSPAALPPPSEAVTIWFGFSGSNWGLAGTMDVSLNGVLLSTTGWPNGEGVGVFGTYVRIKTTTATVQLTESEMGTAVAAGSDPVPGDNGSQSPPWAVTTAAVVPGVNTVTLQPKTNVAASQFYNGRVSCWVFLSRTGVLQAPNIFYRTDLVSFFVTPGTDPIPPTTYTFTVPA